MNSKTAYLFCILGTIIFSCGPIQVPEKIEASFAQKYPIVENEKWGIDSHGNHEAKFKLKGVKHRADFDSETGAWIETEVSISLKDLPEAVLIAINNNYDKKDITEIEMVEHHSKGYFYDVEFEKSGKKNDVEFDFNGVVVGFE